MKNLTTRTITKIKADFKANCNKDFTSADKRSIIQTAKNSIENLIATQTNPQDQIKFVNTIRFIIKKIQESVNHKGIEYFVQNNHYGDIDINTFNNIIDSDLKTQLENICMHTTTHISDRKLSFWGTNYTDAAIDVRDFLKAKLQTLNDEVKKNKITINKERGNIYNITRNNATIASINYCYLDNIAITINFYNKTDQNIIDQKYEQNLTEKLNYTKTVVSGSSMQTHDNTLAITYTYSISDNLVKEQKFLEDHIKKLFNTTEIVYPLLRDSQSFEEHIFED